LVSFLVPAHFAVELLERVHDHEMVPPTDFRSEIGRQLAAWQSGLYKSFSEAGFRSVVLGPYQTPETTAPWFTCWAQTNAIVEPNPRANVNSTSCSSSTGLFVAGDLNTGSIQLSHSYVRTLDLNEFQFATYLTQMSQPRLPFAGSFRKWYTPERCQE